MTAAKKEERGDPREQYKAEQAVLAELREDLALSIANRERKTPLAPASAARLQALEKEVAARARQYAQRDGLSKPDARALQEAKQAVLKGAIREIEGRTVGRFIRTRVR